MKEISCRAIAPALEIAKELGKDLSGVPGLTEYDLDYLLDVRNKIEWDAFATLVDATVDMVLDEPNGPEMFARRIWEVQANRTLPSLSLITSPSQLYRAMARWLAPSIFPNLKMTVEDLDDGRIEVRWYIPEPYRDSPAFLKMSAVTMAMMPTVVGQPEAQVEYRQEPRTGIYQITPPPSLTMFSRMKVASRFLFSAESVLEELGTQQTEITERYQELRSAHVQIQEQAAQIQTISQLGQELAKQTDLDGLVATLNDMLVDRLGMASVSLWLSDEDELALYYGNGDEQSVADLRAGERLLGRLGTTGGNRSMLAGLLAWIGLALDNARQFQRVRDQQDELAHNMVKLGEAQAALQASEERYALAAEGANDGLWDWDIATNKTYYSPRWRAMYGIDDAEGHDSIDVWFDRVHPDEREEARARLDRYLEREEGLYEDQHRIRDASGEYRWVLCRGKAVKNPDGRVVRVAGSHTDITERRVAAAMQEKLSLLEHTTNAVSIGLAVFDNGELTSISSTLRELTSSWSSVDAWFDAVKESAGHELATVGTVSVDLREHEPGGGIFRITNTGPTHTEGDQGAAPSGDALLIRDVTIEHENEEEIRRVNRLLAEARDKAINANRAKSDFLAKMSHELRTPLNAIIGYTELVSEDCEDLGLTDFTSDLDKILLSSRHLLALINDVLDLSKIEAGEMNLLLENFRVESVVSEAVATINNLATEKNNEIQVAIEGIDEVRLDRTKLRQILLNLLSNAVKHTEQGTITVTARAVTVDEQNMLEVAVEDTGSGIPDEDLALLFDAFKQVQGQVGKGGTGLGLTITRHFCRMMGGDIRVSSQVGRGSTFTIRVLAEMEGHLTRPLNSSPSIISRQRSPRVLLIDDDVSVHETLKPFLEKSGFEVHSALDGLEGIEAARRLRPSAILLDVILPTVQGWGVLAELKQDPELSQIPVVMLTIVSDEQTGYLLGADDYLIKPVDRETILGLLNRYRHTGNVLVVEDEPDIRDILQRTLSADGWSVVEAHDGERALEKLAEKLPDVVLLDLMMPNLDGFELIQRLKSNEDWADLPVIVVTALDPYDESVGRIQEHVYDVIAKGGVNLDGLLQRVRTVVRNSVEA